MDDINRERESHNDMVADVATFVNFPHRIDKMTSIITHCMLVVSLIPLTKPPTST